ncbi:MAG TPA: hypothetical protein VNX68_19760 [Nitrosopumilaceae archaeon]|jgi:hypothetical protein|nr:hypothetical protein [Nitrosopumilaceae archaeon]
MPMSNADNTVEYDPKRLLDALIEKLQLKNDAALSRILEVEAPLISKIRHGKIPIGGIMLLRMHDASGLSLKELRGLMGDRREKFRLISHVADTQRPDDNESEH